MLIRTADLYDAHEGKVEVPGPLFTDYGGLPSFHGQIATVKVFEDNVKVREQLEQPGQGRVLVVDGGGSLNCALVGDRLAMKGFENGWAGLVVNGCIRDMLEISEITIGVKALATNPRKSIKRGIGDVNIPVTFAGVTFEPGHYLYADEDGMLVASYDLLDS